MFFTLVVLYLPLMRFLQNMWEYTVGIYEYIRLSTFISTFNEVSSNVEKTNQILTSQVTCVKNHWKENYIKA